MKSSPLLVFVVLFFVLNSCITYSPFVEPMLREFKLDSKNIKSVQFYLSEEIFLFKVQGQQSISKQDGGFVQAAQRISDKITIKRNTPCVVERIDKDGYFYVRFEEGKDKVLKFRQSDNNRYLLYSEIVNDRYQVGYGGELYFVNKPSLVAFLMVRIKEEKGVDNERSIDGKRAF